MSKLDGLLGTDNLRGFYTNILEQSNIFCQELKTSALEEEGSTEDSRNATWQKVWQFLFPNMYKLVSDCIDQFDDIFDYSDPDGTYKEDCIVFIDAIAVFVEGLDEPTEDEILEQMREDGMVTDDRD